MKRTLLATAVAGMLYAGMASAASAAKQKDPPCSINPAQVSVGQNYTVSVSGLPALSPINIVITNANGTTMSPLGSTPDGSFALTESSSVAGTTTYQFTGLIKQNNTQVYSSCSVSAS
jgi:hypothetical protein